MNSYDKRPLLIYDGECDFCIKWANKFKKALPPNRIDVNFEIKPNNSRLIKFNLVGSCKKKDYLWMKEKSF